MTQNNILLCFLLLVKYLKVGSQEVVEHASGPTVGFGWVVCGSQPGLSTTCKIRGFVLRSVGCHRLPSVKISSLYDLNHRVDVYQTSKD